MNVTLLRSLLAALWFFGMGGNQAFPLHYNAAQTAEEDFSSEQREEQTLRNSHQSRHRSRGKSRHVPFASEMRQSALTLGQRSQPQFAQFELSRLRNSSIDPGSLLRVLRI
jgi:hypothetical protein